VRRHQTFEPLTPTAGSWVPQQRSCSSSSDDNEKAGRATRSILNKFTAETFDSLFEQLVTSGIEKPKNISSLMSEVSDMVTKQHNFTPMYANLCKKPDEDPRTAAVVEASVHEHTFRRLLLNQCQAVFKQLLEPSSSKQALDEEACLLRKQEAIGNIKLIGYLLVNGMLGSKLFLECANELIGKRDFCVEALQSCDAGSTSRSFSTASIPSEKLRRTR